MTYLYIFIAILSQLLAIYYIWGKAADIREKAMLTVIYVLGCFHVWRLLSEQAEVFWWMCLLLCLYLWAWCFLLLYVNTKIKQQSP
jgi:hypothetical protein